MAQPPVTVAIGSLGAIGRRVALGLAGSGRLAVSAVSARNAAAARKWLDGAGFDVPVVGLPQLADHAGIVVECAPPDVFPEIAGPAIAAGRIFIPASVGGLLVHPDLLAKAEETGARIVVPTGAIAGLDAVRAAARGSIKTVTLVSAKPPGGLAGAPYLRETGFEPSAVTERTRVFSGNTYEAARAFPANINVAAALALAGIGPERTMVEIWADPSISRNTHTVRVEAEAARFECVIEAVPSADNPRSSALAPLSILAALDSLFDTVRVGS